MAFDGITIANVVKELKEELLLGRIYKIAQPEPDELLLTIKTARNGQRRLFISAGASLPLVYLTDTNKPSPMTAPGFCMLLRKHLQNGRITDITQPGLERIIQVHIEHLNELGDLCQKILIIEIMGKHSNIIFVNEDSMIIDSIKHVSGMVSSVREVLPGRQYFITDTQGKSNPLTTTYSEFKERVSEKEMPIYKAIYSVYTGMSPVISQEICKQSSISENCFTTALSDDALCQQLYNVFDTIMTQVRNRAFSPIIIYDADSPIEFSSLPLTLYADKRVVSVPSISILLEQFYAEKNAITRIRQKSVELRKIVQTALERNCKKYDLQVKQIQDTLKKETYKIYGELLNTYGYGVTPGSKSIEALNYYTNEMITIPLDPTLTPSENAKKYFDKYGKLKRTSEALSALTVEVKIEINHLESIANALDIALLEEDLIQIKEELIESGYIRRKGNAKKIKITSKPFHYMSRDGYHIYVGKNNYQNDELTFKFAVGNDWWFHAKGIPGSHVIVKTGGDTLPDTTFEDAARLAAHYSKGQGQEKVEIDYTEKKNVKKPGGGKPGFVVYYTNFSMMIESNILGIEIVNG